jgi:hypothetical protein
MNLRENFDKLRCARLQEQKERLQRELLKLEEIYRNIINETSVAMLGGGRDEGEEDVNTSPAMRLMPVSGDEQGAKGQQPGQFTPQKGGARRRKVGIGDGQAESEDQTDTKEPFELAKPQQGFALTPMSAAAQKDVLTRYFDNPNTTQREVPQEATWQNLNQAVGNYSAQQVQNLMRQQRMLG